MNTTHPVTKKTIELLPVGTKVVKPSGKPFKSRQKVNTIAGYTIHPKLGNACYTFTEDDSYVEAWRCKELNAELVAS